MVNMSGNYILSVTNPTTENERHILDIINNAPQAPDGFGYKLTKNLIWELNKIVLSGN